MIWVPEVLGGRSPRPDAAAYTRVLMADKPKKQKTKAKKDQPGVLGSLSSARPERIGSHRGSSTGRSRAAAKPTATAKAGAARTAAAAKPKAAAPRTFEPTAAAEAAAQEPAATSAKPKRAAKPKAAAKAKAKAAKTGAKTKTKTAAKASPRNAAMAKPKAAAPRTFEPTPAAEDAARKRPARSRPRPVRDAAPGIGGRREDFDEAATSRPTGTELAAAAAKAAGEVAQLGLAVGGRLLKRATERIPKS